MLKSLFSGVSGLQSHQVAMDVESNNIANVNTTGYKYSRANFSDLLAQTQAIATAPQGSLGGKNAVQIGLGSTVSSMTRIFSQGSVQNSDKNTDVAIQGDGFFIISPDGGNNYKYTRSGDFKFDAGGNFVDNNGFVAQGWLRDEDTGKVDSTAPITNINIAPGLTTPANPSSEVVLKANLNAGSIVESFSPAYEVSSGTPNSVTNPGEGDAIDSNGNVIDSGNMGVMFNETGESFAMQKDQGIWASFRSSQVTANAAVGASTGTARELDITFTLDDGTTKQITTTGGAATETAAVNAGRYISAINAQTAITGISAVLNVITNQIELTNTNGSATASHNIRMASVGVNDNSGFAAVNDSITAFRYQYDPAASSALADQDKTFTTISDLRHALEVQARAFNAVTPSTSVTTVGTAGDGSNDAFDISIDGTAISVAASGVAQVEQTVLSEDLVHGDEISVTINGNTYSSQFHSSVAARDTHIEVMADLAAQITAGETPAVTATFDGTRTITATAGVAGTPFTLTTNYAVAHDPVGTATVTGNLDAIGTGGSAEVVSATLSSNLVNGDSVSMTINGTVYSEYFDENDTARDTHSEVMALLVTAIETDANVNVGGAVLSGLDQVLTVTANANGANTLSTGAPTVSISHFATATTISAGVGVDVANDFNTQDENGAAYVSAINNAGLDGITASYDSTTGEITISNASDNATTIAVTDPGQSAIVASTIAAAVLGDGDTTLNENNIEVVVNSQGKFEITNPGGSADGDYDMNLKITSLVASGITENTKFTKNMEALNAVLPAGSTGTAFSQSFNAATHSSSIDIFDSLGSKHTLRMEFRKTALDTSTGSTWDMLVTVPSPATIDTIAPTSEKKGSIRFNSDGSLATYNPPNISFSGNNGSAPSQQVNLSFGTANAFDGMTSFDNTSATSGISQDGFTGGDLVGIRIDQSGTLIGSFSNGRSFGLAQIAMAKFTNNEGLATEGGNVYIQSANSGDPIIGTAATAGRGFIQSSALEASNVDLSKALTQLIIIQRGFQANGKTITTSDQMLQTLIGLKN